MRLFVLLCFLSTCAKSQINTSTWGVDDTTICIIKTTDFGIVHDYIELFNYFGADLNMRWILETPTTWPTPWDAGFSDPTNVYSDVLPEDTADFILPYPVAFDNQLIIDVDHNNHINESYLRFKVFPIDHPEDSLWLKFCIIIQSPDAGIDEENNFNCRYDMMSNQILFDVPLMCHLNFIICTLDSKMVSKGTISSGESTLHLPELEDGTYIIRLFSEQFHRSLIIIN